MTVPYDFPTAFSGWDGAEESAMQRVIASGRFTMAGEVEAFESEFGAYHGRKHCIMVNSGSSANLVAVHALVRDEKSIATVPALAWATTYAPFMQKGVDLVLLDCDGTWNADQGSVQVPILGNPVVSDYPAMLEDCCESVGARNDSGQLCGTASRIATFSFFYSHQISAIEGGAILTDSDGLAERCRLLRNHGWTRGVKEADSFAAEYCFTLPGFNVRPVEMHAAIAREQLKKLDEMAAERRKNWNHFAAMADGLPIAMQEITSPHGFNPFCIAFTLPNEKVREKLAIALRAEGIDCRPAIGGSFRLQPYGRGYSGPPTPNADRIHYTGMCLGCAPFPIPEKIERAVKVMEKTL